ncbi:MAG: hypothetical protein K5657_08380 [Desulfovibrio sp.]|nr:hypothetical protein [Desulfovibrio sp.]
MAKIRFEGGRHASVNPEHYVNEPTDIESNNIVNTKRSMDMLRCAVCSDNTSAGILCASPMPDTFFTVALPVVFYLLTDSLPAPANGDELRNVPPRSPARCTQARPS